MKTLVMLSNHHVHLTDEACHALFGDKGLTFARYLAEEGGPWSSNELVEVRGPKGTLGRFRVLGPLRPYTQVELRNPIASSWALIHRCEILENWMAPYS